MKKKYYKIIGILIYLFSGFFFVMADSVFASGLEVSYPTVYGQSLATGTTLPNFMVYLFRAGTAIGFFVVFISLTVAGAMYLLSPASVDLKTRARDRFSGALSGLLILILTYLIVTTINPQLVSLNITALPSTPPGEIIENPGVYLYNSDCISGNVQPNISNIQDLGLLKNKINNINIIPGSENSYVAILYDNTNFWGKCQYVASTGCLHLSPFAASISIRPFDFDPKGDGVYFFRKPCFGDIAYCKDHSGGYLKVVNNEIKVAAGAALYVESLKNLKFTGTTSSHNCNVPEAEQDCVKYNTAGNCITRSCPTLAEENISSIKIQGNYLVLLVYTSLTDTPNGPWTFCQEFPTVEDINKEGPSQVKWKHIRNISGEGSGAVPTSVIIIPVKNK